MSDPQWHAETIATTVRQKGVCVFYSELFREKVAFIRAPQFLRHVPRGIVVYNDGELRELYGEGKPEITHQSLKLLHEAKKSGAIVYSHKESQGGLL